MRSIAGSEPAPGAGSVIRVPFTGEQPAPVSETVADGLPFPDGLGVINLALGNTGPNVTSEWACGQWGMYGRTLNRQFSVDDAACSGINPNSVKGLVPAWTLPFRPAIVNPEDQLTFTASPVVADGLVYIGGWDGVGALASVEIFDPATDSVLVGPSMLSARAEHSATTLLRGDVLVAGGLSSAGELQTAEVFDTATGQFIATGDMLTPRRNHLAMLLPHNNSVLITGGWSSGGASETAELYRSWQDGGTFRSAGAPLAARNWAAGSPLSFPASATNRGGAADGFALVDGTNAVVEFLSYEGSFTAADGPAAGMTSTDIGVFESSSTPVGHSLKRHEGSWYPPSANSFGACNGPPLPPTQPPRGPGGSDYAAATVLRSDYGSGVSACTRSPPRCRASWLDHARDVAVMRARFEDIPVILSSATPAIRAAPATVTRGAMTRRSSPLRSFTK